MINNGPNIYCYGCGVCSAICPKNIIKIEKSNDGFFVPFIEEKDKCINCGLCEKVCSYLHNDIVTPKDKSDIKSFSAYSMSSDVRRTSTSGGISSEIAKELSESSYSLCGVEYNVNEKIAKHFITDNIKEFEKSRGSKYIQSKTDDAFSSLLKGNKYVIFGSPCQIDSLRRFVRIKGWEDDYFFVDFFCHGVPSYNLWSKYITQIRSKFLLSNDIYFMFRDKKYGWHNFTMGMYTDDNKFFSKLTSNDLFLSMFLGNYCLNEPCYKCKFRLTNSSADIRFGDLWGRKYESDEKGVSGLLSMTDRGNDLINRISTKCLIKPETLETIVEGQMGGDCSVPGSYEAIKKKLKGNNSLNSIYWRYCYLIILKNIVPKRIKNIIKKCLNR